MKKKILLLSDDIRLNSGIGTMSRQLVLGTAHKYNWVQLAASLATNEMGKRIDISAAVDQELGQPTGSSSVMLYPNKDYGDPQLLRNIIMMERPDMIIHFTDPRFWLWLYAMEAEVRQLAPLGFWSIWDDLPYPMWNYPYYASCDWIGCISQQTYNLVKNVWHDAKDWQVSYVPHGIDPKYYHPVTDETEKKEMAEVEKNLFKGKKYDFVVFYNNRNIRRKQTNDIILAYNHFCSKLTKEQAQKCLLLLHTVPSDPNGTDLTQTIQYLCPDYPVMFTGNAAGAHPKLLNYYYNLSDITINIASAEGFGLATAESVMAGTPILVNCTGGLQDQIGQVDDEGKPVVLTPDFPSNSNGRYKKHGCWAKVVWPNNRSLQGSPPTPYIFDSRCSWEDAAEKMMEWYNTPRSERERCGEVGHQWALNEGGINSANMCQKMIDGIETCLTNWKPRSKFDLFNLTTYKPYQPKNMGVLSTRK